MAGLTRTGFDLLPGNSHIVMKSLPIGSSRRTRKSRFTEVQIIGIIKEQEAGLPDLDGRFYRPCPTCQHPPEIFCTINYDPR